MRTPIDNQDIIDTLADAWSKLDALREYEGLVHAAGDIDPVAIIDMDVLLDRIKSAEDTLRSEVLAG